MRGMAEQAKRSMRSLSVSSCSSLSSLPDSVCSMTFLSPHTNHHKGDFEHASGLHTQEGGSQTVAPSTLGKRRRKRNPEKQAQRRKKRQKENPRKRGLSKQERVDKSKLKQATAQAVQSDVPVKIVRSLKVDDKDRVFDLEAVKAKGVTVVPWDGM